MKNTTHVLEFHREDAILMLMHCADPASYTAFDPHEVCYAIGRLLYRLALRDGWALETSVLVASDSEQSA